MGLKSLVTDTTGAIDMARAVGVFGAVSFIAGQGYALYHGQHWQPRQFGEGFGALAAGVGALLFGKGKSS